MHETETVIESLQPFINEITDMPLPSIPGVRVKFYLEIEAIRCAAVNDICRALITRTQHKFGDAATDELRDSLEPIRVELLQKFPDLAGLLDAETWPSTGAIH